MTKKEMFNLIATVNADNLEIVDFCKHEIDLLNAKSGRKTPTKTQRENESLKEDIFAYVSENGAKRASEVAVYFSISGQKASALLTQLVKAGEVIKGEGPKRVTLFRLAA
jgi:predicted HTH transcriptional regulator